MAAPDFDSIRIGQVNQSGAVDALFLKLFSGEVLTAFTNEVVMKPLHRTRSIQSGKSAQFPVTGTLTAKYHAVGTTLTGQATNQAERTINIDEKLVSDFFIPDIDQAKNHYDYRSIYSTQAGIALAQLFDQKTMRVAILAARAAAVLTGGNGGTVLSAANTDTDASVLRTQITKAAQIMFEKNVPQNDRYAVLKPAQWFLFHNQAVSASLFNKDIGGSGSITATGLPPIAGINLKMSNNVPNTNVSAVTGENNTYSGNFTKTVAPVFQREAIGTVQLMDLSFETEWEIRQQGWFSVAKFAVGHGILRPECAVELATP